MILQKIILAFVVLTFIGAAPFGQRALAQSGAYKLPNEDTGCPANCRIVPWSAGSDQWNGGTLPRYPSVTCTSLAGNGTTNDGPAIQACINAASSGTAVFIPAGVYLVNTVLAMKSNVVLRGAIAPDGIWLPTTDASATTFKLGANGAVNFGSSTSGNRGSNVTITSGYNKGSTSLTLASVSGISTGTWLFVSENPDPAIPVTKTGQDGACNWCGWDDGTGTHLMNQFTMVTAPPSGNTVAVSRPMYYTFQSGLSPVARTLAFQVTKAGLENIRLDGSSADHGAFISMYNSLFCWVSGVETYLSGSQAKDAHILTAWSHGNEIRDSYLHYGRAFASDDNYGIYFLNVNSDHKIENNISRVNRHGIALEGGGAGLVFLYNYIDDIHEDDLTYLGAAVMNHGAHPYMNLYEGNLASHLIADQYWGSSSHNVMFRNWLWGDQSTPVASEWLYPAGAMTKPSWAFRPVEIWTDQHYYSLVGNVLGVTGKWMNPNWSSYAVLANGCSGADNSMYNYGCDFNSGSNTDAAAYSTSINHGNWDFKTNGVAYWDGGSNHTLQTSMYYSSKPAFFGSCAWPAFGPDLNPITNTLPARARYLGDGSCTGGGPGGPASPTNFQASGQ